MTEKNNGRVALVTGAAGGIGAAITKALVAAGHDVAAVDRDAAGLARLGAASGHVFPLVAEPADVKQCQNVVAQAAKRYGRIDAVINNAGIGVSSLRPDGEANLPRIQELTPEIWDDFFAINVRAPMLLVQAALPHMRNGRIINNTTSFRTMLRVLPYGATKSALESMSAIWATELKDRGITVNVLIPGGPTDTPFIADGAGWDRAKMLRPQIMGPPACWLISDDAASYTGNRIIAANWDAALPGAQAAAKAGRAIGWPELGADAVWLKG